MHRQHFFPIVLVWLCAVPALAVDLPYGHADFVPTPKRPIYFRAGNGWYPGATPPKSFGEGTPIERELDVDCWRGKRRAKSGTKVWDLADDKAENLLWKASLPGWSMAHPIVVGKRVFSVGHPYWVVCHDADSGEELWRRAIHPALADGLPAEEAERVRVLIDMAYILDLLSARWAQAGASRYSTNFVDKGKDPKTPAAIAAAMAGKHEGARAAIAMLCKQTELIASFDDPEISAAVGSDLATLSAIAAVDDYDTWKKTYNKKNRPVALLAECQKRWQMNSLGCWWGYVGFADSTLASDGQRIYGVFDQGQIFALDLDGNTVWMHRDRGTWDNRKTFHRSPLLADGVLVVRGVPDDQGHQPYRGFDAETGELRWTSSDGSGYTVPRLMTLTGDDADPMSVFIGISAESGSKEGQPIIRFTDGKVLGHLPRFKTGRGATGTMHGNIVTFSSTDDGGGGDNVAIRLVRNGPDTVEADVVWHQQGNDRVMQNSGTPGCGNALHRYVDSKNGFNAIEVATGKAAFHNGGNLQWTPTIAGNVLITSAASTGNAPYRRQRDDRKALERFVIYDLSDPGQPQLISDDNILAYDRPTPDHCIDTYLPDLDPMEFNGCYSGAASYFGTLLGGVVPHGKRIYIQSAAYLYCVGER